MAEHQEGFAEDVGGKLLLLAGLIAIFGAIALVLMPLGAAFAPPPATPVASAEAPATDGAATPAAADTTVTTSEAAPAPANATPTEGAAPADAAAPQGPPALVMAFFPGIIMLIVAVVLGALSGLFLGYAKARADEAAASPGASAPH